MSNIERQCAASVSTDCPEASRQPANERITTRDAVLGAGMTIRRALPSRQRRMIGAWCFLDHFGPVDVSSGNGLRVGPHPHIGLQTVTWPLQGEILHRDTLGYVQLIRPGQLNVMTAGRGIAHSEESPATRPSGLHGAQLWIALPDRDRHCEPAFDHHPKLPVMQRDGVTITLLAGEALGERSPAKIYSPLVGLDLAMPSAAATILPLQPEFEYGVLVLEGEVSIENEALAIGTLLYLGCGRSSLKLRASATARVLLVGGKPFGEEVLLWWNFVARTKAEINTAQADWEAGRFDEVRGYPGERLSAPPLPWTTGST
jgi:redox-sensitive bicupin YhaK (pirin superfamily)